MGVFGITSLNSHKRKSTYFQQVKEAKCLFLRNYGHYVRISEELRRSCAQLFEIKEALCVTIWNYGGPVRAQLFSMVNAGTPTCSTRS